MWAAAVLAILAVACDGGDEVLGPDAGAPDAPTPGAPTPDAPTPDAPTPDAPTPDAPLPDAPTPDAPPPDAPTPDAPIPDAPPPQTTLTILFAGTGTGIVRSGTAIECAGGPCTFVAAGPYTLTASSISGSTFAGWSGCTSSSGNACTITVGPGSATVTVTYNESAPVTWSRSANGCPGPSDMVLTPAGLLVVGNVAVGSQISSALWVGRYATDGTPGYAFVDDVSSGNERALRIVEAPGGDSIVLASIDGVLGLRRYSPTGTLVHAVAPGGPTAPGVDAGLALDAGGNIYVSGISGGVPYIVSYLPTGAERWRVNAPAGVDSIQGLTVRGAVLAAVGDDHPTGWVGTFDLADGNLRWQRTIAGLTMNPDLAFDDVAIKSNGDVLVGGSDINSAPNMYTMGAVTADGSAQYGIGLLPTRWSGRLSLSSDDTRRVWIGYTTIGQEPSRVLVYDAAGSQTSSSMVPWVFGPGAVVADPAGGTFIAGYDWAVNCTLIQHRD